MCPPLAPSRIYSPHDSLRPVGRISIFPVASARILAVTFLVSFLPGVRANCWIDAYVAIHTRALAPILTFSPLSRSGDEVCDGLTDGARVGIGIAFCKYLVP